MDAHEGDTFNIRNLLPKRQPGFDWHRLLGEKRSCQGDEVLGSLKAGARECPQSCAATEAWNYFASQQGRLDYAVRLRRR
jgi:hypothetical protein